MQAKPLPATEEGPREKVGGSLIDLRLQRKFVNQWTSGLAIEHLLANNIC